MTKQTKNKKVGRPKKDIDRDQVIKLAQMQCTYEEVAAFFNVSKSTISDNFRTEMTKGREIGKISLRRNQFKLSETNATMGIWLGKQYLGQSDNPHNEDKIGNGASDFYKRFIDAIHPTAN